MVAKQIPKSSLVIIHAGIRSTHAVIIIIANLVVVFLK